MCNVDNIQEGYIKIFRSLTKWEWYADLITTRVFIHLLLVANYKEKRWKGITINRGSLATSIVCLASDIHISVRNLRTALNKLKSTNEITIKSTNKFSIITICNYDNYQCEKSTERQTNDTQNDKQTTNKRQTNDKQTTWTKEYKKEINKERKENNNTNSTNLSSTISVDANEKNENLNEGSGIENEKINFKGEILNKNSLDNNLYHFDKKGAQIKEKGAKIECVINFEQLKDYWNSQIELKSSMMPKINSIDKERRASVTARAKDYGKEYIKIAIDKAISSTFLNGGSDRQFIASFDWIFKPRNFKKVIEGNYDDKNNIAMSYKDNWQDIKKARYEEAESKRQRELQARVCELLNGCEENDEITINF